MTLSASGKARHPKAGEPRQGSWNWWSVVNMFALALNVFLFAATVVTSHRILAMTELMPCLPETNSLLAPGIARMELPEARSAAIQEKPKETKDPDPLKVPIPQQSADREFHIIFSTGCSPTQNWQTFVLYHSIMESGQVGDVTRIASGCTAKEVQDLQQIHASQIVPMGIRSQGSTNSRFHLHLTPEFGVLKENGNTRTFKYNNKPYGVAHWMENVLGYSASNLKTIHDDTIIILLDPDMIVLRPFVNDFSKNEVWRKRTSYPRVHRIQHGFPMSQEYGYGAHWHYEVQNLSQVLPPKELPSPVENMTKQQIEENYTTGPPYLATARDFYQIVAKWRQIAWPVQATFSETILAEMFAYSWAAAHLNLPHQQAHSFMVSADFEDGFQLMEQNPNITSQHMCRGNIPIESKPHVLHYCQRYALGKYVLGKHRLPTTFVGHLDVDKVCQSPLLAEPPTHLAAIYDYYIDPDNRKRYILEGYKDDNFSSNKRVDRVAFMLCEMIAGLNRAATYFKQQHCPSGGNILVNWNKSLIFHKSLEVSQRELLNTPAKV